LEEEKIAVQEQEDIWRRGSIYLTKDEFNFDHQFTDEYDELSNKVEYFRITKQTNLVKSNNPRKIKFYVKEPKSNNLKALR
jgi:hypothetical protein